MPRTRAEFDSPYPHRNTKWVIVKHILLALILLGLYPIVKSNFEVVDDKTTLNTLLLFVGLIIVAPMFAYFQFSYEFSKSSLWILTLSHVTTALALFVIGILLAMIDLLFLQLVGNILVFRLTILIYYFACIGYDVWDFTRFRGHIT